MSERIAVFGGVYNNYLALEAVLKDARAQGATEIYCLGDIGGFGPHPNRPIPLLLDYGVHVMQGNYDDSIGNEMEDCQCGYTDPRDNHFAQISYDYTLARTSDANKAWMRTLPTRFHVELGGKKILMAHGSPRRVNEFLWESTTPTPFVERLLRDEKVDMICVTHTGLHWDRIIRPATGIVNVGAIGRPANDGRTGVWYALLSEGYDNTPVNVEFRCVDYAHEKLAREMEDEGLPAEFVETIRTGWWTTCLEILPAKERAHSRF